MNKDKFPLNWSFINQTSYLNNQQILFRDTARGSVTTVLLPFCMPFPFISPNIKCAVEQTLFAPNSDIVRSNQQKHLLARLFVAPWWFCRMWNCDTRRNLSGNVCTRRGHTPSLPCQDTVLKISFPPAKKSPTAYEWYEALRINVNDSFWCIQSAVGCCYCIKQWEVCFCRSVCLSVRELKDRVFKHSKPIQNYCDDDDDNDKGKFIKS